MSSLIGLLFVYVLGGVTFIPLVFAGLFLYLYLTLPIQRSAHQDDEKPSIVQPGDDVAAIENAQTKLGNKLKQRESSHDADKAFYFTICREYVPGGVNGKPPERSTPVGTATVSAPSQSVYQSMYKSIFDRKPTASPLDNKGVGKPQKKGGNVFYVVLRHGHLMLFDDDEQLEVRHVISLAHHDISLYSGGEEIPEGELFIKRNALCLSRKLDVGELTPDGQASKPFYLFSDNCSEKEDFYFALLRNQERKPDDKNNPPTPLQFDVKDIITLVQKLHSSEEHLQTRWINAVIGRIFLGIYKTTEVENFVRSKITKKISRVKTPSFLSKIMLRDIDFGEAAPVITNPRLRDLTVDGEMTVEADLRYAGNFRIEVAATARIDLGSRFKAREVNLLLAVLVKRIEGHVMIKIKPPPSNRLWITFQTMPKVEMAIEPIVSSRQITYTLILRHIENRIKEVFAESLVFPFWDDFPFFRTEHKKWRGGIWEDETSTEPPKDTETAAAQEGDVDEVQNLEDETAATNSDLPPPLEKSMSMPLVDPSPANTPYARKNTKSVLNLGVSKTTGSSSSVDTRSSEKPRAIRSGSFANASLPLVSTDNTNVDAFKPSTPPEPSHAMHAMSALSQTSSPPSTPVGSPPSRPSRAEKAGSLSSISSGPSVKSEDDIENDLTPQATSHPSDFATPPMSSSFPPSPSASSLLSAQSGEIPAIKAFGSPGRDPRRQDSTSSSGKSSTTETKRNTLAAMSNAAATAKKWGWNAIQRQQGKFDSPAETPEIPGQPIVMGRGRPLPPPGVPLPPPDKKTKTAPIPVPKRKAVPSPNLPQRQNNLGTDLHSVSEQQPAPPPPLPRRPTLERAPDEHADEGLFVVAAPKGDSEPSTPMNEEPPASTHTRTEDGNIAAAPSKPNENLAEMPPALVDTVSQPPKLPKRRPTHRAVPGSPVEDGPKLPSWITAQEEEARVRSTFVDEDTGL